MLVNKEIINLENNLGRNNKERITIYAGNLLDVDPVTMTLTVRNRSNPEIKHTVSNQGDVIKISRTFFDNINKLIKKGIIYKL